MGQNQPKTKSPPMRQCLGCNEHRPKTDLLRVVRDPEGRISLDFTGKKSGRGAYICRSITCLRRVRKSRRLEKNLNCPITEDIYDRMEQELAEAEG